MGASSVGCCIRMDFGEQGLVPVSWNSWGQRDLALVSNGAGEWTAVIRSLTDVDACNAAQR